MSAAGPPGLRVALTTLGCKVNRADSEHLLALLKPLAVQVPFHEVADLYIVNSCTVTAEADRQTRQLIYRARRTNPAAVVVLTGCLAQARPDVARSIAAADHVFTLAEHQRLVALANQLSESLQRAPVADLPLLKDRGRPLLKLQDGCNAACSYCVVPLARGPSVSVPLDQALRRLRTLAAKGCQEVVLTGIHLGLYGQDLDPPLDLTQAVRQLLGVVPRLRLSSIEPLEVTSELVELVATEGQRICPQLHIPVQSGDDRILRAMRRPYQLAEAWEVLAQVRQRLPHAAIGSDLIVGFPGETMQSFANSLDFVKRSPLTHLHVFPFSPRPGTVAAELPGQVSPARLREWVRLLRVVGQHQRQRFAARQVGTARQVLVERRQADGLLLGLTDNYLRVTFPGEASWIRKLVIVMMEGADQGQLRGRPVTAPC